MIKRLSISFAFIAVLSLSASEYAHDGALKKVEILQLDALTIDDFTVPVCVLYDDFPTSLPSTDSSTKDQ